MEEYLNKNSYGTSKEAIQKLDELFMKYSLMEQNLSAKKAKLNRQIPEIENNIQVLDFLAAKSVSNLSLICLFFNSSILNFLN